MGFRHPHFYHKGGFSFTGHDSDLPINASQHFLRFADKPQRDALIARLPSEEMRRDINELYPKTETSFRSFIESTENRLRIFKHPQIRRILSDKTINIPKVVEGRGVLLANLQRSRICDEETNRVIGTLLVSELTQYALQRRRGAHPFFLVIDECQNYITPDISTIVDQTRKRGFSLLAFHQRLSQLPKDIASALDGCKTKLIFSTADDPKPQRHFDCIRRAKPTESGIVNHIADYPIPDEMFDEYVQTLRIDHKVTPSDDDKEWDDEDFYRE